MSKSLKIILFGVCGFAVLLVCIPAALVVFVDVNSYKPRFEAAASKTLGMDVKVDGRLGLGFFPGLHVTLADASIRNRGVVLVDASEARLGIALLPLLHKKVHIGKIVLKGTKISIERDPDGRFNFENPEAAGKILSALNLPKVSFSDGTLSYTDQKSKKGFEAGDCRIDLSRLMFSGGKASEFLKNLSLQAEATCGEIRTKDYVAASDLQFTVAGKDGVFEFKPVVMQVFGGQGSGSLQADFTDAAPVYQVRCSLAKFHIEDFLQALSMNKVAAGLLDFSADLSIQGKSGGKTGVTVDGEASLRGKNLTLIGIDLDQQLSRVENSQNFNLVDVGAVLLVGPLGLAITKGYNFASIFRGSEGGSEVRTLISNWKVANGVAQAQDVALATAENRLALRGGLDFVNDRFNDVTMAVIDEKGCVKVQQEIRGTFREPVVEKPNFFMSITGPARNLIKEGVDLLGGDCKVFYTGAVAPPK